MSANDYTPTTEEVREAWGEYKCSQPCKECPVEFDRWLAEVKAEVWQEGMMSVKKHVSCWPKQDKLPVNPYIPEIGKTPQHTPELGNNV